MRKLILSLACSALICTHAEAFDFNTCAVVEIVITGDQNAHVQLDCAINNVPPCATANTYFAFDKSTPAGNQYLAMVMAAQAMNAKLTGDVDHSSCPPFQGNVAYLMHLRMLK